MGTQSECSLGAGWLTVEAGSASGVLVTVTGGVGAGRAVELWEAIEGALEWANGRVVMVDLTRVTGFDRTAGDWLTTAVFRMS